MGEVFCVVYRVTPMFAITVISGYGEVNAGKNIY